MKHFYYRIIFNCTIIIVFNVLCPYQCESTIVFCFITLDGEESGDYQQIGRRQSSLHSQINYKTPKTPPLVANKKKPGLFKGIGSMFR